MNVGDRRLCKKILDVGYQNDQNRHQYLIVVANTLVANIRHQHRCYREFVLVVLLVQK